jgi:hypothetical protein
MYLYIYRHKAYIKPKKIYNIEINTLTVEGKFTLTLIYIVNFDMFQFGTEMACEESEFTIPCPCVIKNIYKVC